MSSLFPVAEPTRRVGVVLGTRPEAVKLAPLVVALRASAHYEPVVVSTGQHRDLLAPLLGFFGVQPDLDLDLMRAGQSLADLAGLATTRIGQAIEDLGLDLLVVQGDTTTTLAGALAGFYHRVPVVHVEAGLRTDDRLSPYPEEVNRRAVTQLADLHLAPTDRAAERLLAEGVDPSRVLVTGNTVIDALFETVRRRHPYAGPDAAALADAEGAGRLLLVTAHRRESWGVGLDGIAEAVGRLVDAHPDLTVVFPVHPNPLVREPVRRRLGGSDRVLLAEPLDYPSFVRLLARADLVLTDSGGIQEEACSLGRPTLVARDTTERPEGIEAGGLRLVGTDPARIVAEATRLLTDPAAYGALVCRSLPFGDGTASARAVAALDLLFPVPLPGPLVDLDSHATPA
ncbi:MULTISPECIES: non-hydrolyzing UDP-N-acetylglucosamine 2-epimerase [unclassified Nocardioides]|uniref:non-hydrolyzing UDP-N-acetylglucosamine 2-epimerase n=1 Tax=unclassified Nocardioides TaxID=2615069 RepID=UPI003014A030